MLEKSIREGLIAWIAILCLVTVAGLSALSGMSSRDLARNYAVDLQISQTENNEANRSPGNGRPQSLEYGPTKYTTPQGNSSESIDDKTESDRQLVKFTSDLAGYTEAMAIATISLVIATTGLGVLGYLQLADVRRSADIAERSLTELEAPFISVRIIDKGVDKIHGITDQEFGIMRFSFSNYGRIPVHLRQVEEKLTLISFEHGLPEEFDLNFSNRIPMPRGVISVPGIDSPIFTSYLIRDISNELAAARSQPLVKNELFFYGFVRYDTIFGQKFRLGFCFIFDRYSDGWVLAGEEKYNYLKPES